jgi:hypothetical protein
VAGHQLDAQLLANGLGDSLCLRHMAGNVPLMLLGNPIANAPHIGNAGFFVGTIRSSGGSHRSVSKIIKSGVTISGAM